jgi:hypothetical protein
MKEAEHQLKESMACPEKSYLLQEAINNICSTWQ